MKEWIRKRYLSLLLLLMSLYREMDPVRILQLLRLAVFYNILLFRQNGSLNYIKIAAQLRKYWKQTGYIIFPNRSNCRAVYMFVLAGQENLPPPGNLYMKF